MKQMTKQNGFSLIELLVVVVVFGIIAAAFAQFMLSANLASNGLVVRQDVDGLRNDISSFLITPSACEMSFSAQSLSTTRQFSALKTSGGVARYQTTTVNPTALYDGVQILNMSLSTFEPSEPSDPTNLYGKAKLTLTMQSQKRSTGAQVHARAMSVYIKVKSRVSASPDFLKVDSCSTQPLNMIGASCKRIRSPAPYKKDAVEWCPSSHPLLLDCTTLDDTTPAAPVDLTSSCNASGPCTYAETTRIDLGGDLQMTELVKKSTPSGTLEGCLVYDESHEHKDYKIEVYCCE